VDGENSELKNAMFSTLQRTCCYHSAATEGETSLGRCSRPGEVEHLYSKGRETMLWIGKDTHIEGTDWPVGLARD
jgi:hypothetical protein